MKVERGPRMIGVRSCAVAVPEHLPIPLQTRNNKTITTKETFWLNESYKRVVLDKLNVQTTGHLAANRVRLIP